ncbi:MAG: hypothetical protein KA313_10100 [Pseudarcicella sp.]|nr:hypothetical protein [Pseudarcicella sp.]MBP6411440.1 hypothetical protein [Pseudarcicella sp.]
MNNKFNPDIHHRKSIRLNEYDYSQEGLYFITMCVQNRENIFGDIENHKLTLNPLGEIAQKEWLNTINIRDNIKLHEFIIMPNHIHGIIEITKNKSKPEDNQGFKSPTQTIGSIVRGFKIATIKQIKEYISKGELQFAPTSERTDIDKGELQFAPTIKNLDYKIWQRNYYEHIIKDEKAYKNISSYILTNPERWIEDKLR